MQLLAASVTTTSTSEPFSWTYAVIMLVTWAVMIGVPVGVAYLVWDAVRRNRARE